MLQRIRTHSAALCGALLAMIGGFFYATTPATSATDTHTTAPHTLAQGSLCTAQKDNATDDVLFVSCGGIF